jgi:NAD(P)-dependent dehydrogenase (short-subunit alcohol dehydrogenase family)
MTVPAPRVAVVTGAAGGIGAAACRRLAADGFAVACLDVTSDSVAGLAGELPGALGLAADVRDSASVRQAAARIRAELGPPWLLVNAAGVFSIQRVTDLAEDEWDRIIDTNLKGPFLTCREFLPEMIAARDGCIVNVASTAGVRGGRQRAAYCASKGGLVQLTRSLAIDHGPDGVRVNCGLDPARPGGTDAMGRHRPGPAHRARAGDRRHHRVPGLPRRCLHAGRRPHGGRRGDRLSARLRCDRRTAP